MLAIEPDERHSEVFPFRKFIQVTMSPRSTACLKHLLGTEISICASAISSWLPLFSKASSLWSSTIKTRRRGKHDIDLLPPPTKRRSMSLRLTSFSFFGKEELFLIIYKIPAESTSHGWVLLCRSFEVERKTEILYSLSGSRTERSDLNLTSLHIWEILVE